MPAKHGKADKGSQKWLQLLVNDCPELLNREIARYSPVSADGIRWLSPLEEDNYREYYDSPFIEKLGAALEKRTLESFWPASGPRWDGLGNTDKKEYLLVEAKSHIKEMRNTLGSGKPDSASLIHSSLAEVKRFVGSKSMNSVDWAVGVYQYANRLAHLYFLHQQNDLDAYLVLLYFLNATEMAAGDTYIPKTAAEWKSVIVYQDRIMGIRQRHPLSDRIIHVFMDVKEIEDGQ